jgi:predicted RecB family nuclease
MIDGRPVYSATDLVGFLACAHRLALERAALAGLVKKPIRDDPTIELIAKRGIAHEARYLDDLRAAGRSVVEIVRDGSAADDGAALREAAAATEAAMRAGADVIYQATFFDGAWRGHADFLLRVTAPSALGSWSYEVADTKLARRVKASAVLQICSYVAQLAPIQGAMPELLHVVLGGSERATESYRVADFMAYFRRVRDEFEAAVSAGPAVYPVTATYPEPVEHCDVCRWSIHCQAQRRRDDDLSLVAGISAGQRRALKDRGVATRRGLAGLQLPVSPKLPRVSQAALARVREQARIQVEGEDAQEPRHELLDPERDSDGELVPDRGFLVLPPPSSGDLFFDIEGDPFAFDDGIEYLFGVLEPAETDPQRPTEPAFHEIWSRDGAGDVTRAAEKRAFEALVDLIVERLERDPGMHVYHYAAYERTALGRLAQRHATRELEVDRLLRGGVLVDLYRVVRQGIRASVESYSIKRLEPLYGLEREVELRSAGSSIVAFEAWLEGGLSENGQVGEAILREIAGYNRDDVVSNWRLRDWLEDRRSELERRLGSPVPRPGDRIAEPPKELGERELRVQELVAALTAGVPDEPEARSDDEAARWLLAQLLGWHRREDKAFWWRFYELAGMTDEELVDEREPLGRIEHVADLEPVGKGGLLQLYRFPPQDHGLKVGRAVIDPAAVAKTGTRAVGTVRAIDEVLLTVTLQRTAGQLEMDLPHSLIPSEFVDTDEQQDSLARIADWVIENGLERRGRFGAARELLRCRPPRLVGGGATPLRKEGELPIDSAVRLGLALDETTLPIQGPPGSGKTFTAAQMIVALVRAGKKVGVTANSHRVIGNALDAIDKAARQAQLPIRLGQRHPADELPACVAATGYTGNAEALAALDAGDVQVLGGTSWLWSRDEVEGAVDVLFVDEAAQFSLANALAVAPAASSLVLLGDPQQLEQPIRGSHPPGAERSALGHVLGDRPVMPEGAGLFLDRTWRLHPDICAYTSEVFYASQLRPIPELARQQLRGAPPADGTGLRWHPVGHEGNAIESIEEAEIIVELVGDLLAIGPTWTTSSGDVKPVTLGEIVIVAPYNAHVELIGERLAAAGFAGARVGTVDKFQGQEAAVSIYAMGSSSAEEAPRGMEFLYSLNRLNVATSRARCAAIVVASPALIRVSCHSPRQMQLANALCRLVEVASEQATRAPELVGAAAGAAGADPVQLSWIAETPG